MNNGNQTFHFFTNHCLHPFLIFAAKPQRYGINFNRRHGVLAYHGHFKEEQVIGTRFMVDLYIEVDTGQAERSDNLHDTVNYLTVYQTVKKEMEQKSHLLEHVAHRILKAVHARFPDVSEAEVKISKLNPPLGGK
ncbi:MAG: dihydroneopterin aldolase [Bacteroidales bacterium]|nr:dihydroneopterin aldolase [Bacteroidales bacterium]